MKHFTTLNHSERRTPSCFPPKRAGGSNNFWRCTPKQQTTQRAWHQRRHKAWYDRTLARNKIPLFLGAKILRYKRWIWFQTILKTLPEKCSWIRLPAKIQTVFLFVTKQNRESWRQTILRITNHKETFAPKDWSEATQIAFGGVNTRKLNETATHEGKAAC